MTAENIVYLLMILAGILEYDKNIVYNSIETVYYDKIQQMTGKIPAGKNKNFCLVFTKIP